jgi:Flp pilus assembly protein CpaB
MEVTQKRPVGTTLGRWSSTRRGTIMLALVSALIAAGILAYALHQYRQSIATPSKSVTVLVANRFIEKGTSGAAIGVGQYFKPVKMSEKQVAVGALTSSTVLHGEVAAIDIYPNQQLTASDFVGGGLFYSRLPRNMRAVSVPVDASHGMIGNIQTGDRADVYVSFPKEGKRPSFVRLVAPDVVVLDAGHLSTGVGLAALGSTSNGKSTAVLEVTAHQAGELAFSGDYGKVWLVLSPAHGTTPGSEVINEASIYAENPAPQIGGTK